MYVLGIDGGSTYTKLVAMQDGKVVARAISATGVDMLGSVERGLKRIFEQTGLRSVKDFSYIVATGYGRISIPYANKTVTEIIAQTRSLCKAISTVRTIIDIGGQDVKAIKVVNGKIKDFIFNDKCAAGTGRFLEALSKTMGLEVKDLGQLSLKASKKIHISSTCTVFAESEIISHIARGTSPSDIVAGLHDALAERIYGFIGRMGIEEDVVLTGGGALNIGLVRALEEHLGVKLVVPDEPLYTCADGAAYIADKLG